MREHADRSLRADRADRSNDPANDRSNDPANDPAPVQRAPGRVHDEDDPAQIHAAAARGTATAASALPYLDAIQRAFGRHDISSIRAHLGDDAASSARAMGAGAYATGDHVVMGEARDLFTVAHEAAHIVQQRGGVQLAGGVGAAGDAHERHADEVAALVVQGKSAEALLDRVAGSGGAARGGVVQRKTALKQETQQRAPAKLGTSAEFEHKLGIAAYRDHRSLAAATDVIDGITAAVLPDFDQAEQGQQDQYAELFGKDAVKGAWSAGQVGKEWKTLFTAVTSGNLRERMTAIYNASLAGFKTEVLDLIEEERWDTARDRGLDVKKLKRRKQQMKVNPGAQDLYRDPGNPLDRKALSSFEPLTKMDQGKLPMTGNTRSANPPDQQHSGRTVGELERDGVGLSEREKRFMYQDSYDNASLWDWLWGTEVKPGDDLKWKEGGTYWQINDNNKWVRKCKDKLHLPVTAGPSGTALRLFQAWEFLGKPANKEHFRLALLGWMMTSNDHSFHEIMMTAAEYGLPYEPGLEAYRNIAPYTEAELRGIASPKGFPDEENYQADHMTSGSLNSVFATEAQIARFQAVLSGSNHLWTSGAAPTGGELAHAMAVLVYTDEGETGHGSSAYKFINNVLKGKESSIVMLYHLSKEGDLKQAYDANKFNIKQLVAEAKLHARYMQEGLKLLRPFTGQVYRGYRSNTLPKAGQAWTEQKFFSMSQQQYTAAGFADKGKGKYHLLVEMTSVTGRDLSDLTMFPGEQEVIFPHGSSFTVASDPVAWPGKGPKYYKVGWTNA
jgi:hypothetical protein